MPGQESGIDVAAFAHFFELAPDALVMIDASGRIIVANSQVERVFGYTSADLLGHPIDELVPERFQRAHAGHRASYFDDPRNRMMGQGRLDLRGRRKDGSEFPAEIALTSIETTEGRVATAAIRDITERVNAERERAELEARLVREQALAQASRMESVGQLAGGVAHDFNNVLSVIMGNAGFLAGQLTPGTPEHEEIEEIRRASAQAARLTRQLLMFSRREVIEPQPLDLNEIVREVERLLRRTLGEHVELVTRLADALPPVQCDPGNIEQILVNLAVNARDAMTDGGTLTIETLAIDLGEEDVAGRPELDPGAYARVAVTDTGEGMPPEVVVRALEPFFSTKPKGEGTGLGLATVYGVVRQAGGGIELDSQVGRGTVVRVDLPVAAQEPEGPRHDDPATAGAGQHVLLVEDDDAVRRIATRILRRNAYQVTSVDGGPLALERLGDAAQPIDLLLTDVIMPDMPGPDLAERIRALRPDLPVVFMSGYIDPVIDLTKVPDALVVRKPFTEASLTAALRSALCRATAAS